MSILIFIAQIDKQTTHSNKVTVFFLIKGSGRSQQPKIREGDRRREGLSGAPADENGESGADGGDDKRHRGTAPQHDGGEPPKPPDWPCHHQGARQAAPPPPYATGM